MRPAPAVRRPWAAAALAVVTITTLSWKLAALPRGLQVPGATRPAAVAGAFYPADPVRLRAAVDGFLRDAVAPRVADPRVLVAPHAGFIFSGQIAADAFGQTRGQAVDTVVILGANHTTGGVSHASVYDGDRWQTPLGAVPIDRDFAEAVVAAKVGAVFDRRLHEREHSIEVQVPFVQVLHPGAKVVPIVVGAPDPGLCERLGRLLASLAADRRVVIVASSDLAHYPPAADARRLDARTLEAIVHEASSQLLLKAEAEVAGGDGVPTPGLSTRACGLAPLLVATAAARALGARRAVVLSYANSADTLAGSSDKVVGYGAVAFGPGAAGSDTTALAPVRLDEETPLDDDDRRVLLRLARETIARRLESDMVPLPRGGSPRLLREAGAFVTLRSRGGALRGCVGRILPEGPLIRLVSGMALAAAFADKRFGPLKPKELPGVEIEVSVLTTPRPIKNPAEIVLGRDGVVLQVGDKASVFLPNVAQEEGWTRDDLLDNLALKAGLASSAWRDRRARLLTFRADAFRE